MATSTHVSNIGYALLSGVASRRIPTEPASASSSSSSSTSSSASEAESLLQSRLVEKHSRLDRLAIDPCGWRPLWVLGLVGRLLSHDPLRVPGFRYTRHEG